MVATMRGKYGQKARALLTNRTRRFKGACSAYEREGGLKEEESASKPVKTTEEKECEKNREFGEKEMK